MKVSQTLGQDPCSRAWASVLIKTFPPFISPTFSLDRLFKVVPLSKQCVLSKNSKVITGHYFIKFSLESNHHKCHVSRHASLRKCLQKDELLKLSKLVQLKTIILFVDCIMSQVMARPSRDQIH